MNKRIQAVFIDRDGTIGGNGHFIHPNDFEIYPFTNEALNLLKKAGIKIFAFTNQHRISRGQATLEDFKKEFEILGFDDSYICPHPMDGDCTCHKPRPGMLLKAAQEYELELRDCVVIGDVGSDMVAANEVGAMKVLVKTGWGEGSLNEYRYKWEKVEPDYIAENLLEAMKWILDV